MQRTNEEELDLFADLLEPVGEILSDNAVASAFRQNKRMTAIKYAIKNHKSAVIEILARVDDTPVEEYHVTAVAIPIKIIKLLNNPEVKDLFTLQGMETAGESSSSATVNIEAEEN